MRKTILVSKVNFFISVVFIGSFGIFAVSTILNVARMDNPIANLIATQPEGE